MTTKSDLINTVYTKTGIARKDIDTAVNQFINELKTAVQSGREVKIDGLGTFTTQQREAREGRNPATGEPLHIEASKSPKFKAASAFKALFK